MWVCFAPKSGWQIRNRYSIVINERNTRVIREADSGVHTPNQHAGFCRTPESVYRAKPHIDTQIASRVDGDASNPGDWASVRWPFRSIVKKTSIRKNVTRSAAALVVGGAAVASMGAPAHAASESTWDALANCESGGNWGISTGNGFSGGLQFTPSTWAAFGGTGSPTTASKAEQIRVAENVLAGQGWGAWPSCSSQLGLTAADAAGAPAVASAPAQKTTVTTQTETVTPVAQEAPVQTAPVAESAPVVAAPVETAPVATAPVAEAAPVAVAPVAAGTYTVQAGDTLSEIAFANGYSSYWDLANANGIANPDVIEVGQVLVLPAA